MPDVLTRHLYSPREGGEPIPLYQGSLTIGFPAGEMVGHGDVRYEWSPTPHVRWTATCDKLPVFRGATSINDLFDVSVMLPSANVVPNPPIAIEGRTGAVAWSSEGWLKPVILGLQDADDISVSDVTFLVANFPNIVPSAAIRSGSQVYMGRIELVGAGWRVKLDAVPEISEVIRRLRSSGGYAATHIGLLAREEGAAFSRTAAVSALEMLETTLSLATGRRVSPLLPVGLNTSGRAIWAAWGANVVDRWHGGGSLLGLRRPERLLPELFRKVIECGADELELEVVRRATSYYVEANDPSPIEMAVASAQAGLDMLSWTALVEDNGLSDDEYRRLSSDDVLRRLLERCGIDAALPSDRKELPSVVALLRTNGGARYGDGPELLTRMRNTVIHPSRKKPRFSMDQWIDAWHLAKSYLESAILARLDCGDPFGEAAMDGEGDGDWHSWASQSNS